MAQKSVTVVSPAGRKVVVGEVEAGRLIRTAGYVEEKSKSQDKPAGK